ncbi:MAG: GHKL domain-containing protein [Lachnospiraceae bacterium]|nr:GHKL domain-containing protein [Lachnospiraceae bacterium]
MPLYFRLATIFLVFLCFGFGIFKMALGLLGQKMKKLPCAVYVVYFCAVSWGQSFLIFWLDKPWEGLLLELAFSTLHAAVLGILLTKIYRVPLIQTLTAAVLEVLRPMNPAQTIGTEDLLRVLGILLDNALDAAARNGGIVRIILLQEEKELYLAVANNYDTAPDLSALVRKGYTTKGKGHGTGLSSYRKIISRYRGCVSRTYLKEEMFVQELHIPAA